MAACSRRSSSQLVSVSLSFDDDDIAALSICSLHRQPSHSQCCASKQWYARQYTRWCEPKTVPMQRARVQCWEAMCLAAGQTVQRELDALSLVSPTRCYSCVALRHCRLRENSSLYNYSRTRSDCWHFGPRKLPSTFSVFMPLNISLSHSRSLHVTRNDTLEWGVCKYWTNYIVTMPVSRAVS